MISTILVAYLIAVVGLAFVIGLLTRGSTPGGSDNPVEYSVVAMLRPVVLVLSVVEGVGWLAAQPIHKWRARRWVGTGRARTLRGKR